MAGITSSVAFNAVFFGAAAKKTVFTPSTSAVSSVDSNFFGLRLCQAELSIASSISSSPRRFLAVSALYGGGRGGGSRSSDDSRRGRQSDSNYEKRLAVEGFRSDTVRLLDEQRNEIGIISKYEAMKRAEDADLDLFIVSQDADPPVVRLMDYSKYRYNQLKKKKEQLRKTSRVDLKELKMGYNIDEHDYSVRLKAARKFLQDGCKVKVMVNMKGRENNFRNIAIELIKRFRNDVGQIATEESKNFTERNLFIVLVPNKDIVRKTQVPLSSKKKKKEVVEDEVGL